VNFCQEALKIVVKRSKFIWLLGITGNCNWPSSRLAYCCNPCSITFSLTPIIPPALAG